MADTYTTILAINGHEIPDAKSGNLEIAHTPKYTEYEMADRTSVIEVHQEGMLRGSVSLSLLEADIKRVMSWITTVSSMDIYDPATDARAQITALIEERPMSYIIKDSIANAWGLSFTFRQIA